MNIFFDYKGNNNGIWWFTNIIERTWKNWSEWLIWLHFQLMKIIKYYKYYDDLLSENADYFFRSTSYNLGKELLFTVDEEYNQWGGYLNE